MTPENKERERVLLQHRMFDLVFQARTRLLAQGRQAADEQGTCKFYTGPGGPRCALGLLVSEDMAQQTLTKDGVDLLMTAPELAGIPRQLLLAIQWVHDQVSMDSWETVFAYLGGLVYAGGFDQPEVANV